MIDFKGEKVIKSWLWVLMWVGMCGIMWVLIDKEMEMGMFVDVVMKKGGVLDWYEKEGGEGLLVVSW